MQNFEQIRAHVVANYKIKTNDPYLLGLELTIAGGSRRQGIFLAELEGDDGRKYLRVSTAIAPMTSTSSQ